MSENKYLIPWDPNLSVGISWIDNQHKKLLDRINILLNAIVSGKSSGEITPTIKFLESYIDTHFSTEERYMLKYAYPQYGKHKEKHDLFKKIVQDMKDEFSVLGGSKEFAVRIEKEIWNWYKTHITRFDRLFGDFLDQKEISDTELKIAADVEELTGLLQEIALFDSREHRKKVIHEARDLLSRIEKQIA